MPLLRGRTQRQRVRDPKNKNNEREREAKRKGSGVGGWLETGPRRRPSPKNRQMARARSLLLLRFISPPVHAYNHTQRIRATNSLDFFLTRPVKGTDFRLVLLII